MRARLLISFSLIAANMIPQPAFALETSLQYVLTLSGDIERREVLYDCEGVDAPITVEYVNAAPNFLAIIPIEGKKIVFANISATDGVRYAAGPYQWWTKGADAALYDVSTAQAPAADQPPAAKLTCLEHNNIP